MGFKNCECVDEFLPKPITVAAMIDHVKKHVNHMMKELEDPPRIKLIFLR